MTGLRRTSFAAMGTRVEVTVDRGAAAGAEAAVQALFAEREALLSRFRADSELSRLAVLGLPAWRGGWTLAVRTPDGTVRVTRERGAPATSGEERRSRVRDGVRRHHLVDPATGAPAGTGLWSATAVGSTCAQAEVAATAAFVLGAGPGSALLARLRMPGPLVAPPGASMPVGGWPAAEAA